MSEEVKKKRGCLRFVFRWTFRLAVVAVLFLVCAFLYIFWDALYNRFYHFPKVASAWDEIRSDRVEPSLDDGWTEYRGICHSHSELSHDSVVPFPDIIEAAQKADVSFICMSDHCVDGRADYSLQLNGIYLDILFVPGFEMSGGFMPWGLPYDTVLDCGEDPAELARRIDDLGGALFIAHSEEERPWDLPQISGMEIYNIHTDFTDEKLGDFAKDIIFSLKAYPDQVMRGIFDRQTDILAKWDELNKDRYMAGIAANDAHQNTGYQGYYTDADTFLLTLTNDQHAAEVKLGSFSRMLLRLAFGPLEPGKRLFRIDLDPYERSLRFVNNHVLAEDLTEKAIVGALKSGRSYIAFDMIADARGFVFFADNGSRKYVMGETAPMSDGLVLRAGSPNRVRFTLVADGKVIDTQEGREYEYKVPYPGKYRLEAELPVLDEWVPWVYTNPIVVGTAAPEDAVDEVAQPGEEDTAEDEPNVTRFEI
ncbi:MAG: hypothetical protein KJ060_01330 [Candidatus Hydrogenedentes bacterium]|nr:hypothetical protein [Candidatus Hydrogenedentota bacterium]